MHAARNCPGIVWRELDGMSTKRRPNWVSQQQQQTCCFSSRVNCISCIVPRQSDNKFHFRLVGRVVDSTTNTQKMGIIKRPSREPNWRRRREKNCLSLEFNFAAVSRHIYSSLSGGKRSSLTSLHGRKSLGGGESSFTYVFVAILQHDSGGCQMHRNGKNVSGSVWPK